MQNVLITPHVSGGYHVRATHDKIVQIASNNLSHLVNQEMFENIVDMSTGRVSNKSLMDNFMIVSTCEQELIIEN